MSSSVPMVTSGVDSLLTVHTDKVTLTVQKSEAVLHCTCTSTCIYIYVLVTLDRMVYFVHVHVHVADVVVFPADENYICTSYVNSARNKLITPALAFLAHYGFL